MSVKEGKAGNIIVATMVVAVPCLTCGGAALPAAPGTHVYADADGARMYHAACVPTDISGRCYVCKAPTQREHPFTVAFITQGWVAERGVCASNKCYEYLAKEAKDAEGIDAGKWCLACDAKYDIDLPKCPKCGKV